MLTAANGTLPIKHADAAIGSALMGPTNKLGGSTPIQFDADRDPHRPGPIAMQQIGSALFRRWGRLKVSNGYQSIPSARETSTPLRKCRCDAALIDPRGATSYCISQFLPDDRCSSDASRIGKNPDLRQLRSATLCKLANLLSVSVEDNEKHAPSR